MLRSPRRRSLLVSSVVWDCKRTPRSRQLQSDPAAGLWYCHRLSCLSRLDGYVFFISAVFFSLVTLLDRLGIALSSNGSSFFRFPFPSLGTHMALKIKQLVTFNESHPVPKNKNSTLPARIARDDY
jgi:hypothetical protein